MLNLRTITLLHSLTGYYYSSLQRERERETLSIIEGLLFVLSLSKSQLFFYFCFSTYYQYFISNTSSSVSLSSYYNVALLHQPSSSTASSIITLFCSYFSYLLTYCFIFLDFLGDQTASAVIHCSVKYFSEVSLFVIFFL